MNQAIELEREQSHRVLQCASRAGARIVIRPKALAAERQLNARLLPVEDEHIRIRCDLKDDVVPQALLNMYCECELPLEDGRYIFDSYVVFVMERESSFELTVSRPDAILVHQRRRSSRLAVASSSDVQLSRDADGQLQSCEGRLYNLSRDGMAFNIAYADAKAIAVGQVWCVCFELPNQEHCYKLSGRVSRKLPSSEHSAVIVGMEFACDTTQDEEIERLGAYLDERQTTRSSTGVRS